MTFVNTNVTVLPHIDDGDVKTVLPALQVIGRFDRSKGRELWVSLLRYVMHEYRRLYESQ